MAVYGFSLNATIDGIQQTVLRRYTVPDDAADKFFAYYMAFFNKQEALSGRPPLATQTDVFFAWAKMIIDETNNTVRRDIEKTTAKGAVDALPPPIVPVPS